MLKYTITTLLVIGILWGCVDFWRSSIEYRPVRSAYLPVASEIRRFAPGMDPDKYYVRCMVNQPMHFEWQFSLPSGLPAGTRVYWLTECVGTGGLGTIELRSPQSAAWLMDVGPSHAFWAHRTTSNSSSGTMDFQLAQFLQRHWDDLEIETLGIEKTEAVRRDQLVTLLRIDIPPHLLELAEQELAAGIATDLKSPVNIVIGAAGLNGWKELAGTSPSLQRLVELMRR